MAKQDAAFAHDDTTGAFDDISRAPSPPPAGDAPGDDKATVFVPSKGDGPEVGRLFTGQPIGKEPDKPPRKGGNIPIRGNEIRIHVKHRGRYAYVTTVEQVPTEDELRDAIPALRTRGGRVKLLDELGGRIVLEVHPLHPMALRKLGYESDLDDDLAAGAGPGFVFPPGAFQRPEPVDWKGIAAVCAPIGTALVGLAVEFMRRPAPAPVAPPVIKSESNLRDAIEALSMLQQISNDSRPEEPADGVSSLVQAVLGAVRPPPGALPGAPPPYPLPPGAAMPAGFQPPQPGQPVTQPAPQPAPVRASTPPPPPPTDPNLRRPAPGAAGSPPTIDDPDELAARDRLEALARACGMTLDQAVIYLRGATDGRWVSMLAAAEAGLQNLASFYQGEASDEAPDETGTIPE
jgi:hypothetical protein